MDLFANDELKDDLAEVEALASAITFEELQANDVGISKEDFIRGVILDLRVVAWEGKLQFRVPRLGGRGDCNKRGTAAYMGKPVSSHGQCGCCLNSCSVLMPLQIEGSHSSSTLPTDLSLCCLWT